MMYIKRIFHYRQNYMASLSLPFRGSIRSFTAIAAVCDGAFPVEAGATLSLAVAEALVPAVTVAVLPATCAAGCSSQWNGSKYCSGQPSPASWKRR